MSWAFTSTRRTRRGVVRGREVPDPGSGSHATDAADETRSGRKTQPRLHAPRAILSTHFQFRTLPRVSSRVIRARTEPFGGSDTRVLSGRRRPHRERRVGKTDDG